MMWFELCIECFELCIEWFEQQTTGLLRLVRILYNIIHMNNMFPGTQSGHISGSKASPQTKICQNTIPHVTKSFPSQKWSLCE